MNIIGRKIDYTKELKAIKIKSVEANQVYMDSIIRNAKEKNDVEYKIKNELVKFKSVTTHEAVMNDSLFLRFIKNSITIKNRKSMDFIVIGFSYDVDCVVDGINVNKNKQDLRIMYYQEGVTFIHPIKNKKGEIVDEKKIKYKMLMRSTGKAKDGECIFIREDLFLKAINFLTMGLYDLLSEEAKKDPDKVFDLVALSAYQTLSTATAMEGYIQIPFDNILVVKDEEVYSDGMNAEIVELVDNVKKKKEFQIDFESLKLEKTINKKGFTYDEEKAKTTGLKLLKDKTKDCLKENGFRINGIEYPGETKEVEETIGKKCIARRVKNEKVKNVLWDGMGICNEEIFPKDKNGFIYCRSHFFKSCLFRGNIQEFFKDYCKEKEIDYETRTLEEVDMFGRKMKLSDVQVIISDKSIKWLKPMFLELMGGTKEKAFDYYYKWMNEHDNYFSVVKTAHSSKLGDLQLMAYQMNNSLPTVNEKILGKITKRAVEVINSMKNSDEEYLKYLEKTANDFNINAVLLELIKWNPDFLKTELFRKKKNKDISKLKEEFCEGRLPQVGDNLTIMDNPISLLLKAVGDNNFLEEGCFNVVKDGVQCYTARFKNGERLAAFRSPHNSPNNIIHLYNVYPDKLERYFPNLGKNVIVFNAIKTDTQFRLNGQDCDTDSCYTTNQTELAELAREAYMKYSTIINKIEELGSSNYHFTLEDYAKMDSKIADAQQSIGTSTDTAQLALSYYYDEGMKSRELEEAFIILSVIGQISIDLAKREFDINVVNEINRIKNLPCIKDKDIPQFFYDTKKSRKGKPMRLKENQTYKRMDCPMDIMGKIINKECGRQPRNNYLDINELLVHKRQKAKKYKVEKIIQESEHYVRNDKWIEENKNNMEDDTYIALKRDNLDNLLKRASKNLNEETIRQLVIYALDDDNKRLRSTMLNFLFKEYKSYFLKCFVTNKQKAS